MIAIEALQDFFLFEGLTELEKTALLGSLPEPREFQRGDIIYDAENFEQSLGIVRKGVLVSFSGDVEKRSFHVGDVFGAAAMFGELERYSSQVTAKTGCQVQFIPEPVLEAMFARYPRTALNYIAFLSSRIRFLNRKIALFTSNSATEKLYRFLQGSADENGVVTIPNMTALSRITGMGRTSLYRAMDALFTGGVILRDKNKIRMVSE